MARDGAGEAQSADRAGSRLNGAGRDGWVRDCRGIVHGVCAAWTGSTRHFTRRSWNHPPGHTIPAWAAIAPSHAAPRRIHRTWARREIPHQVSSRDPEKRPRRSTTSTTMMSFQRAREARRYRCRPLHRARRGRFCARSSCSAGGYELGGHRLSRAHLRDRREVGNGTEA